MSAAYYFIPKTAACAPTLEAYFAKERVAHDALLVALRRWGAKDVSIYGEGRHMALSKMRDKPGWKWIRSRGWWRPDPKTDEGKRILQEMKELPVVGKDPKDLSDEVLDHGLLAFAGDRGFEIHWATFIDCPDKSGYVMVADSRVKKKCSKWPKEAVEITHSEMERRTQEAVAS